MAAGAVLVAALGFGVMYRSGLGFTHTRMELQQRREGSNAIRLAGLVVAYRAIRESPVLGHGSWARSDEALDEWATLQEQLGGEKASDVLARALLSPQGSAIRAHSGILQAWVEAGVVGLGFFLFSFVAVAVMLLRMIRRNDVSRYFALACFFALWTLWAFVMSPFAGVQRLYTAVAIALLFVVGSSERFRPGHLGPTP